MNGFTPPWQELVAVHEEALKGMLYRAYHLLEGVWFFRGVCHTVYGVVWHNGEEPRAYYTTACTLMTMDFSIGEKYSLAEDLAVRPDVVAGVVNCFKCVLAEDL